MDSGSTVIIADEFEMAREGISQRLKKCTGIDLLDEAADGYSAIKKCRASKPDVLLINLAISNPSGLQTIERLRRTCPEVRILVLVNDCSLSNAFYILSQGAVGFISEQAKGMDVVDAVRAAAGGYSYFPIEFIDEFVKSRRNLSRTGNLFGLSPREIEILEACLSGRSTQEVAQSLDISVRTVETHRSNIYRKTSTNCLEDLAKIFSTLS